jgi:hypothetical protein
MDNSHLAPVGLELVGHDASERGAHMLAHLGADDVDSQHAAAIHAVPDGRLEQVDRCDLGFAWCRQWELNRGTAGAGESHHGAGPYHGDQEAEALNRSSLNFPLIPSGARGYG